VSLCTVLRDAGHDVRLYDYQLGPIPEAEALDCDVLCVSGMSHQAEGIARWIALGRAAGRRVVVGGIHATIVGGFADADCSVIGHAEDQIVDAVDGRLNGVVAGSYDGLDAWPLPDRGAFGWSRYAGEEFRDIAAYQGLRAIRLLGYVGCPFRCKFCCEQALHHGRTRFRDPARIEAEVREEQRRIGMGGVTFIAPTFTLRREWAIEVAQRMKSTGVLWQISTRVDYVDEGIARLLKACGCVAVGLGIESGSDRVLEICGKGTTTEQAREAANVLHRVGLGFYVMFIPCLPGETRETMAETDRLANELRPPFGVCRQRFSPLPGSEFCAAKLGAYGRLVPREQVAGGFGEVGFIPHGF